MSLGKKLAVSCGAIVVVGLALSCCSWNAIRTLGEMLDRAANTAAKKMDLVAEIRNRVQDLEDHAKRTQLAHAIHKLEAGGSAGCSSCHGTEAQDSDQHEFEALGARVLEKIAALRPLIDDSEGRAALDHLETGVQGWVASYNDYLRKFAASDFAGAHDVITAKMLPLVESLDRSTALLWEEERTYFAQSNAQAAATAARSRGAALLLIVLGALIVCGIMVGAWRTGSGLRELAATLARQAALVAAAAERVSNYSNSAAEGASEQANSIEEVSSSNTEINETAQKNAGDARTSAQVSTAVAQDLADANGRLEQLMTAMVDIQSTSSRVCNIMKVIDEIAFQTNILALNAAVEAARAGESGLGFAVVAGEVRTLAQRSAQAAQETAELIEESMAASQTGMARLSGVQEAFHGLCGSAETVTRLAGDVQAGSLEQVRRVEGIAERVAHMRSVTARATSGACESAQASEELKCQADELNVIVGRLSGMV